MSTHSLSDRKSKIKNCAVGRFEYRAGERPRWARTLWNEVLYEAADAR